MAGELRFDMKIGRRPAKPRRTGGEEAGMRILLMGDFSGHSTATRKPLDQRSPVKVDIDNFEKLLHRWSPAFRLPGNADDAPIVFHGLDGFHPDALVDRVPNIAALRRIRARLLDENESAAMVAEMQKLAAAPATVPAAAPESASASFDNLIGGRAEAQAPSAGGSIAALIQRVVQPHVAPGVDPQASQFVAAINDSLTAHLRAVLHDAEFQALEATWRAAHWVVSNVETSNDLQIHLLDITRAELAAAFVGATDATEVALHRAIAGPGGNGAWSVLATTFQFGAGAEDVELLGALGALGASVGAPFLGGADPALVGCNSPAKSPDPRHWSKLDEETSERWTALRRSSAASWLGLAMPRIMLRLPYGRATDPIEAFPFEETPCPPIHEDYLWGSSAFACALLLGQAYMEAGQEMTPGDPHDLGDLPIHSYTIDDEVAVTPSGEAVISESAVDAILARGLIPMVSFAKRNVVRVARFQSIADPPAGLSGQWT